MPHFLGGARDVIDGTVKEVHSVDGFNPFTGNIELGLNIEETYLSVYTAERDGFVRVTITGQLVADSNQAENVWNLAVKAEVANHVHYYDFFTLSYNEWAADTLPARFTYPNYQLDHSIYVYVKKGDTIQVRLTGSVTASVDSWNNDGSFRYAITYEYDR